MTSDGTMPAKNPPTRASTVTATVTMVRMVAAVPQPRPADLPGHLWRSQGPMGRTSGQRHRPLRPVVGSALGRWSADASWRQTARPVPSLAELRRQPALAIDLNADHLNCWVPDPADTSLAAPHTIALALALGAMST
jgi:hypothetical protein